MESELISYRNFIDFLRKTNLYNEDLPIKTIYKKAKHHIDRRYKLIEFCLLKMGTLPPLGIVNYSMMGDLIRINESIFGVGAIICKLVVEDCKIKVKMKNTKISR